VGKSCKKLLNSFLVVIAISLFVAPNCENILEAEGSLYPQGYNETVERAMVKSILWANDGQIRRLVNIVEKNMVVRSTRYQKSIMLARKTLRLLLSLNL
jgi:hypothetical protein